MESTRADLRRLRTAHSFLAARSFYPLLLSSALAYGLLAVRIGRTHSWAQTWLAWNLILAWVPYLASLWALSAHLRRPHRPWLLIVPGALWLIFLPNAPYIVTDFVNLSLHRADDWVFWYDTVQLAIFAWTGCILGVTSLSIMHSLARAFAGRVVSWLFVLGATGLCGVGVYLGRFHRWNSWDLLTNPSGILADVLTVANHPASDLRPWGLSGLFAAFMLVCYVTFTSARAGLTAATPLADDRGSTAEPAERAS